MPVVRRRRWGGGGGGCGASVGGDTRVGSTATTHTLAGERAAEGWEGGREPGASSSEKEPPPHSLVAEEATKEPLRQEWAAAPLQSLRAIAGERVGWGCGGGG